MVSHTVDMWPVHEFTNRDMATACLKINGRLVYISSVYMDGTVLRIDETVQRLATLCRTRGIGLIICSDTNVHSTLWGYDESDDRRHMVEDLLSVNQLKILNTGCEYTFKTSHGRSIIHITIVNDLASQRVHS